MMVPDQCATCGELGEVESDGFCSFSCRVEADILAGARPAVPPEAPSSGLPRLPTIPPYPDGEGAPPEPEGLKYDDAKLPLQLLPFDSLEAIAQVLQHGAIKYDANNWRKGIVYSRLFGACMRHLFAWWRGQDHDPDTGYSHLAHAACCVVFLLHFVLAGAAKCDDRAENNT